MTKVTLVEEMRTYTVEAKDIISACDLVRNIGFGEVDSAETLADGKFQVMATIKKNLVIWEMRDTTSTEVPL